MRKCGVDALEEGERQGSGIKPPRAHRNQYDAEDEAHQNLQPEFSSPRQSLVLMAPKFLVVVPKPDDSERHRGVQSEPHEGVAEVRPKQRGTHDAQENQHAAHRGCPRLRLVRLRPVLANVLAHLDLLQQPNHPRA